MNIQESRRENTSDIVIVVQGNSDLFEIVFALGPSSCLASLLHCGQQQSNQNGNNRDNDEQFDQREALAWFVKFHGLWPAIFVDSLLFLIHHQLGRGYEIGDLLWKSTRHFHNFRLSCIGGQPALNSGFLNLMLFLPRSANRKRWTRGALLVRESISEVPSMLGAIHLRDSAFLYGNRNLPVTKSFESTQYGLLQFRRYGI
jgi:hypothetical protein